MPASPTLGDVGTHIEHESHPWSIAIPDHPERTESPEFHAAKAAAHRILASLDGYPYGPGPWQMHHGGSLWTYDGSRWFLMLSTVGIEWSAQFCADPDKVDGLRMLAKRHYNGFPETQARLIRLGYLQAKSLLEEQITDAEGVARWVDSLYNSCVPLAAGVHTGVVSERERQVAGGVHHYPKPITDIQFVKREDFRLWVVHPEDGSLVAVVPVAPPGSGDGRVEVLHSQPGTQLHDEHQAARLTGRRLILDAEHPLARAAFRQQG